MAKAKVLTKDEARRVLRIAETGNHGQRDKLALALSILGGMRVGEIAALKMGDVRGIDGKAVEVVHLTRHQTKGNRSRRVFLADELRRIINGFLSYSMNVRIPTMPVGYSDLIPATIPI